MSNCIWVKQYMRQGTLVREHQRCYNRPLSKADKDLYDEVKQREKDKWDEYMEASAQTNRYAPLIEDAQRRNSPLLPSIEQQQEQAGKQASKKFDDWVEESNRAEKLAKELGIEDDPYKKQIVTPDGLVIDNPIPASPSPISGKPKPPSPSPISGEPKPSLAPEKHKPSPISGKPKPLYPSVPSPISGKPKTSLTSPSKPARRGKGTRKKKKKGWLW